MTELRSNNVIRVATTFVTENYRHACLQESQRNT